MGKILKGTALASVSLLAACGSEEVAQEPAGPVVETIRSCDSIRDGIINLASGRGVTIVKIYEPKTLLDEPKMVSCSGRAMVDSGQQTALYYRSYEDQEGDRLLEYSEEPFK